MNRRAFLATLLSAPLAAVAALKAKQLGLLKNAELRGGWEYFPNATSWSGAGSTPIADIEAAMKKIREGTAFPPQPDRAWLGRDAFVQHARLASNAELRRMV